MMAPSVLSGSSTATNTCCRRWLGFLLLVVAIHLPIRTVVGFTTTSSTTTTTRVVSRTNVVTIASAAHYADTNVDGETRAKDDDESADKMPTSALSSSLPKVASSSSSSTPSRRSALNQLFYASTAVTAMMGTLVSVAPAPCNAAVESSSSAAAAAASTMMTDPSEATITHKLFMNVRISRQDGTFYVRDDLDQSLPENKVFQGQLVIGLFGKNAPNHVERFLSYATVELSPLDDNPLPSYSRSRFTSFDQATGLLLGGEIPSLEVTEVSGSTAIRYGGRLLPASLWIERRGDGAAALPPPISHTAKGLLTHRLLDATPAFGITTRRDTTMLDRSHTVFGKLLLDESPASQEFLTVVQDLPTYSVDRPASMTLSGTAAGSNSNDGSVVEDAAGAVFNAQREFFRNAAKSFGDTRLDKVYQGKLLRRVEVTKVGLL